MRLRTERYTQPNPLTYRPTGAALQDFAYEYDLVGNITQIRDRTPESGIPNSALGTDALNREFIYDPLYRLLSASGRECDRPPEFPWDDQPRCTDITRTRAYTEHYQYDPAGNIKEFQHQINGGGFTRVFGLAAGSNRLATVAYPTITSSYRYDLNGNLIQENTERHFEWDHSDQLRVFRTQTADVEPTQHAHYLYDASGQRVKKLLRKRGLVEVTVYIDSIFEHHTLTQGGVMRQNNSLHVWTTKVVSPWCGWVRLSMTIRPLRSSSTWAIIWVAAMWCWMIQVI
ncbi:MAG: RHS repeat domain-containing protein [Gammaproteobacteria bacterium]